LGILKEDKKPVFLGVAMLAVKLGELWTSLPTDLREYLG
jgi:hypothetical protein